MAITETAAASSAAAEAADAAVHGPDLSMGTEHLTDAIADTTNYFVVLFEKLLEGLAWGNVLFQLCVIVVAVLAGLMCSKLVRSVVARHMPPHELKERFTQRMKRLALSVVNAIAFGLAAGSVTACCAYGAVMMGYQASSLVLLKVAYSFFYAYSLLAIVLGLLQAMVGSSIISPRITKSIVVTFWILAILQFFGVLTHLVDVLDATAIPIGSGNMTVWKLFMAVCSVLLTVAAANWISEMIEQTITDAKSLTGNIKVVLGRVVRIFLMVIAVIIGLGTVGIDLTILSVFGGALGVTDVSMNVQSVVAEKREKRAILSGFHAAYSFGGMSGGFFFAALVGIGLPVWAAVVSGAALMVAVATAWSPWSLGPGETERDGAETENVRE